LSVAAGLLFVVVGLEELPVGFNVARVARAVRRRAAKRKEAPGFILDMMLKSTRRSVPILVVFDLASAAVWLWRLRIDPPGSPRWAEQAPVHLFGLTLVLGLLFLVFAFWFWAPRLIEGVRARFDGQASTTNATPQIGGAQS
jgi:hypothetical protein